MKMILRVNPHVVDTPARIADEKLPMTAIRMLAEAYSTKRGDEALLLIDQGKDGNPVYMTVGSNPLELAIGGRQVWGVFDPPESQEPVATFFDEAKAKAWAETNTDGGKIGQIDATDRPSVRVSVMLLIFNKGLVLMGKLKQSGIYALPEGMLEVGETIEHAVQRTAKTTVGLDVGRIGVSREAPYVNTFLQRAGQHFLSLVMVAEYTGGTPAPLDPLWESCDWHDGDKPPEPLLVTVRQIIELAKRNTAPPPEPMPTNPPKLAELAGAARKTAKKLVPPKTRNGVRKHS